MPRAKSVGTLRHVAKRENRYCERCDKIFARPYELKRHLKTTLQHNPDALQYPCQYCYRHFTQKSNRDTHERTHNADQAEHCGLSKEGGQCSFNCNDPSSMCRHILNGHTTKSLSSQLRADEARAQREKRRHGIKAAATVPKMSQGTPIPEVPALNIPSAALCNERFNGHVLAPSQEASVTALFQKHGLSIPQISELPHALLEIASIDMMCPKAAVEVSVDVLSSTDLSDLAMSSLADGQDPLCVPEQPATISGPVSFIAENDHLFRSQEWLDLQLGFSTFQQDQPLSEALSIGSLVEDSAHFNVCPSDGIHVAAPGNPPKLVDTCNDWFVSGSESIACHGGYNVSLPYPHHQQVQANLFAFPRLSSYPTVY